MSIPLQHVRPRKDESYFVGVDDHCFVLSSTHSSSSNRGVGYGAQAHKIWISKSMVKWLYRNRWMMDGKSKKFEFKKIRRRK